MAHAQLGADQVVQVLRKSGPDPFGRNSGPKEADVDTGTPAETEGGELSHLPALQLPGMKGDSWVCAQSPLTIQGALSSVSPPTPTVPNRSQRPRLSTLNRGNSISGFSQLPNGVKEAFRVRKCAMCWSHSSDRGHEFSIVPDNRRHGQRWGDRRTDPLCRPGGEFLYHLR